MNDKLIAKQVKAFKARTTPINQIKRVIMDKKFLTGITMDDFNKFCDYQHNLLKEKTET